VTEPGTGRASAARSDDPPHAGTRWLVAGSLVGGLGAYAFQVVGTRTLGEEAYAPIGTLWTIQYLVWSVVLFAVETLVIRETMRAPDLALPRPAALGAWRWIAGTAAVVTVGCWVVRDRLFFGFGQLAFVAGAIVLAFGALAVVRGRLAGRAQYRAYGVVSAAESVVRLGVALAVAVGGATTRGTAWALPIGAAVAASSWFTLGPPVRERRKARPSPPPDGSGVGRFLLPATLANGAAQLLLAGGPVAMVALSASAAELSVFFVTLTAARVPIVLALGGILSRLLPDFAGALARRGRRAMSRIAAVVATSAVCIAAVGAAAAVAVGGQVVGALFGNALAPPGWLAAAATVGVVLATGGLVLNQLLIAAGSERRLVAPWMIGLISAIVALVVVAGTPSWRVATSFVVGEAAALGGLVVAARTAARKPPPRR
jgi:O-antigen/teichoic acid export membrane protein